MTTHADDDVQPPAPRPGRPRDESRDDAILDAARELIAERGFGGMTMDAVASRAGAGKATVYRRWSSKSELAVDAITRGTRATLRAEDVPDTGTLRGDLAALAELRGRDKGDALMPGLISEMRTDADLAHAFHERFVTAKVDMMRSLLERAKQRGEIPPERDVDLLAEIGPALTVYRKVVAGLPVGPEYLARITDEIVVPLATAPAPGATGSVSG
ncbi:TetR family transcriptional regulator [Sediminihabitans luteus]|uniref:TetR family transcriptional regulator n=1 Tax=Sediminihabitans luteus TaxID=1138585 RepID=A0A2M9CDC5_9CELL|nr:TetR/AcrR family transcriptional regulator [Sediminihabitans luteus]PJJ69934.1 TetR family transcriptional regulator [Sediminihabitans luteus]GII99254.1 putative TetR-family transcriptional regulator [Sediminihabitans luteus]